MRQVGKCVHFNGVGNDCCKADVNYKQLAGPEPGYIARLPCHGPDFRSYKGEPLPSNDSLKVHCERRREPTAEEVEADRKEMELIHNGIRIARKAIVDSIGGPWKRGEMGISGSVDCPICKGVQSLRFSRSGYNGHIHAGCTTKDCVAWME